MRVLLVDDEDAIIRALTRLFTRHGHEVRAALGGEAAMSEIEGYIPDVVVCDYRMDGVSGAEVLRSVHAKHPAARLILLSGFAEEIGELDVRFVMKPYDADELLRLACD
jgi:DNA-binding NtrC family response regulator